MARPQSGIRQQPLSHSLIFICNVLDMAMNAMSVGQFSVMVPGLVTEALKKWPGERMVSTVGFGRMFWLLVWHTGIPRGFREIDEEDLEGPARFLPVTGGDILIYLSASRPELLDEVEAEIRHHLRGLVEPVESFRSDAGVPFQETGEAVSHPIFIESEESDFTRGTFAWVQLWRLGAPGEAGEIETHWRRAVDRGGQGDAFLPHVVVRAEEPRGAALILTFFRQTDHLETVLTGLAEDSDDSAWPPGVCAESGAQFFVPSVDVLIGLRMGGIRMNRFSPTRQFD